MQEDLKRFRASKTSAATPVAPAPEAAAPDAPAVSPIAKDLAAYRARAASGAPSSAAPKDDPNALAEFAKGIFSAPATLVARPFQAAAELAGVSSQDVEAATKKIPLFGGLVAPVPQNFGDVKKDVGRAAQTIALGTGAPIAGGALFGTGASLEAGNDLLSAQTAFDAALGGAGGKVLELVGKPLLNAAGKVVGVITPKIIKDTAAKGAEAISKFAAEHQLLGGIAAKPSAAIAKGLQAVDEGINTGVSKTVGGLKKVASEQFPQLDPTQHFKGVNERDILRPTTVNEPKYSKATAVYDEAKSKGIDLEKVASERGIIHDKIAEGGKYNTADTVENLRQGNYSVSDTIARPAIKAAEPGVRLVPIGEIRGGTLKKVHDIPAAQITPEDRAKMIKDITKRYADDGAAAQAHPNGYSLTDLHDNRIVSAKNGKYKIGQSPGAELKAQLSREEGRVFASVFDRTVPEELQMKDFRKELEKNFMLADYLESLHSKKIPEGITKKAVRLFGRAAAATVGGKIGGFPGAILGSQYGDMLFSSFESLPNPIKMKVLQSVQKEQPKIFKALVDYIGTKEAERLLMKALPAGGSSSFKETKPTLFSTPGGVSTPNKGEALDVAAVEQGRAKAPGTDRRLNSYRGKVQANTDTQIPYVAPKDLPVIKAGRVPKKAKTLKEIY